MTDTRKKSNLSTDHQAVGDAMRPSDTLDRSDEGATNAKTPVEDRPNVGRVRPEDYPSDERGQPE